MQTRKEFKMKYHVCVRYMLFVDDLVLTNDITEGVTSTLQVRERWRDTPEYEGSRLSRSKAKYLECKSNEGEGEIGRKSPLVVSSIESSAF